MYRSQLILSAVVCALAIACSSSSSERAVKGDEARALVENRNWLDVWPTSADEKLMVYRFTPAMGGGVFQDRTLFRGQFELFTYKLSDEQIVIHWPQNDSRDTIDYKIERVSGPEPFDLRLTLRGNSKGPKVLYGRSAETGDLEANLRGAL